MKTDYDIMIVGGGLVGMTAAMACAQAGFEIALIDKSDPKAQLACAHDGRASAIAAAGFQMMQALGVAARIDRQANPIEKILISDGEAGKSVSPLTLFFDGAQLSETGEKKALGHMVENHILRAALLDALSDMPNVNWIAPAIISDIEISDTRAVLRLDDGQDISAPVIVAADGRNSFMRNRVGIDVSEWDCRQKAIVTTVAHERPHDNVAHELFLPSGPFAILPLTENRANIVWTDTPRAVDAAMALPEAAFASELARRFGDFLGEVAPVAPRWSYPLSFLHAASYTSDRMVLIGDAAHSIHPIAGQGFNMGLRDAAALADIFYEARQEGRDLGSALTLDGFEAWRKFDNTLLTHACDIFNRLFSNNIAPIKHARRLGLGLVDKLAPARGFFMREASGQTGDLPTLLRGERYL